VTEGWLAAFGVTPPLPPQTDAIERALCESNGCVWDLDPDSDSRQQWRRDVAIVLAALKESK